MENAFMEITQFLLLGIGYVWFTVYEEVVYDCHKIIIDFYKVLLHARFFEQGLTESLSFSLYRVINSV